MKNDSQTIVAACGMKRVSTVFTTNTSDSEFPFVCHGFGQINLARQSQEPKLNQKGQNLGVTCGWPAQLSAFYWESGIDDSWCVIDGRVTSFIYARLEL